MILQLSRKCKKQAERLPRAQQKRLHEALSLFMQDPHDRSLYNHPLTGQWKGCRPISFGGDWRAHYKAIDANTAYFVALGTHNQLYK